MDNYNYRKWIPILESRFPDIKNRKLLEIIANYCEWKSVKIEPQTQDLIDSLDKIYNSVKNLKRLKVKGMYFNPIKMCLEYKLEDGIYVNTSEMVEHELSNKEILQIFGNEFMKDKYLHIYRDLKIKQIKNV
jgi:hypothetical protein